ncbi:carboxymuconolactone decarboxylase family protein [Noviherbaspirillum cavernae]|uniref:Alkyl hydroperoxide reductase AhpD n=1 Tax=Noviherbaspirillum cavernae TaxID=2320862 RepID=A0A418X0P8_9BURK|nr:carboxymuconolactone decarboxylase family protein [Noviherbaspirillum cavernae]
MLAAAFALKSKTLVDAIRDSGQLAEVDLNAALTAASLMGMNNVWCPYVEMADDNDLKTHRPELRMNAYATHGGEDRRRFELYALAASIVGKCHFCIQSHYKLLKEVGMTATQLRDVGRIAAVVVAAAQVLAAEGK